MFELQNVHAVCLMWHHIWWPLAANTLLGWLFSISYENLDYPIMCHMVVYKWYSRKYLAIASLSSSRRCRPTIAQKVSAFSIYAPLALVFLYAFIVRWVQPTKFDLASLYFPCLPNWLLYSALREVSSFLCLASHSHQLCMCLHVRYICWILMVPWLRNFASCVLVSLY